jgi:hypothetical protein
MFAEVAFYRLVYLEGTQADLRTLATMLTVFRVSARSARGVDLSALPFAKYRRAIASPTSHAQSQPLGRAMRDTGVKLFPNPLARDPRGGANVGAIHANGTWPIHTA